MTPGHNVTDENGRQPTRSIWVGSVPSGLFGAQLKDLFTSYGTIESVSPGINTPVSKGFAFVNFHNIDSAVQALRQTHGTPLFVTGQKIQVRFADPPSQSGHDATPDTVIKTTENKDDWFTKRGVPTGPRASQPLDSQKSSARLESMTTCISPPRGSRTDEQGQKPCPAIDSYRPSPRSDLWMRDRRSASPERDRYRLRDTYRPIRENSGKEQPHIITRTHADPKPGRPLAEIDVNPEVAALQERVRLMNETARARATAMMEGSSVKAETSAAPALQSSTSGNHSTWNELLPVTSSSTISNPTVPRNLKIGTSKQECFPCVSPGQQSLSPPAPGSQALLRLRSLGTDDNASITSSSTRTSIRKLQCADCKGPETALRPYTTCTTCDRRYHSSCGAPSPSSVRGEADFICGRCLRKDRVLRPAPSLATKALQLPSLRSDQPSRPTSPELGEPASLSVLQGHGLSDMSVSPSEPTEHPTSMNIGHGIEKIVSRETHDNNDAAQFAHARLGSQNTLRDAAATMVNRYKQVTCSHWLKDRRGCRFSDEANCMFTHNNTGVYSPYMDDMAKSFTCYDWHQFGRCSRGDQCRYAHRDTGMYVNVEARASIKHITCAFWRRNGRCKHSERECLYAHADTGVYSATPAQQSYSNRSEVAQHDSEHKQNLGDRVIAPASDHDVSSLSKAVGEADGSPLQLQLNRNPTPQIKESVPKPAEQVWSPSSEIAGASLSLDLQLETAMLYRKFDLQPPGSVLERKTLLPSSPIREATFSPQANDGLYQHNQVLQHGVDAPYSPGTTVQSEKSYSPRPDSTASVSLLTEPESKSERLPESDTVLERGTPSTINTRDTSFPLESHPLTEDAREDCKANLLPSPDIGDQPAPPPVRHFAKRSGKSIDPRKMRRELAALQNVLPGQPNTKEGSLSPISLRNPAGAGSMDGQMSEQETSKSMRKLVKVCKGCGKKIFASVDNCAKCQEQFQPLDYAAEQIPSPAESLKALEDFDGIPETSDLQVQPLSLLELSSSLGRNTSSGPSAFGRNIVEVGTLAARWPKSTFTMQSLVPMKRGATSDSPFIISKKAKMLPSFKADRSGLLKHAVESERNLSKVDDSSSVPPSIEALTEEARRQKAAVSASSNQKQDGEAQDHTQAGQSDKENRQPSISSISDDVEVIPQRFETQPLVPTQPRLTDQVSQDLANESRPSPPVSQRLASKEATATRSNTKFMVQVPATNVSRRDVESTRSHIGSLASQPSFKVIVESSKRRRKACQMCRDKHNKCCHNADGSWNIQLCREFFDEHKGMKASQNGRSRHEWKEMRRAAGLSECDIKDADEAESTDDRINDDSSATDESSEKIGSDLDESSSDEESETSSLSSQKRSNTITPDDVDTSDDEPLAKVRLKGKHAVQGLGTCGRSDNISVKVAPPPIPMQEPQQVHEKHLKAPGQRSIHKPAVQVEFPLARQKILLKPSQSIQIPNQVDNRIDPLAHSTKMRAVGIRFDEDSDEDMSDADQEIVESESHQRKTPFSVEVSHNLFDVAPSLRPRTTPPAQPKFQLPGQPMPSRKEVWKHLSTYQCRERRKKFRNPHQTISQLPERIVTATIRRSVPDGSGIPGRPSIFHVNPVENKKVRMPFREFLGGPTEPMVVRDGPQNDLAFVDRGQLKDPKQFTSRGGKVRKFAGVEKYPFTKS